MFTDLAAGAGDARIVASNPAGMTRLDRAAWRTSLIVSYSESTWESSSSNLGGFSKTDNDSTVYIPSLFYVRPLGERWRVGFSLSATSGMGDDGDEDAITRYLSTDWSVGSFTFMPAVAYELSDTWSVGAGVGVNYTIYNWEAAVFNGIGQPDGQVEIDTDDVDLNFVLGVIWQPTQRTRFGLSYRSEYSPTMEDKPKYSGVPPENTSSDKLQLEITMPQSLLAGVHHEFGNGHWASLDLLWIDADQFNIESAVAEDDGDFTINPYQLDDTWVATIGWGMPFRDRWEFGLGAIYLDDPIDDANRSIFLRADSLWGLGASIERRRDNGMVIGANVSTLFTGDAPVETPDLPVVGVIEGKFSDRTNLLFEVFVSW